MTCTPQALVLAAICFTKFHKHDLDAMGIYLMCQWANSPELNRFSWEPDTAIVNWVDSGGAKVGNLATYNSTADDATVSSVVANNRGITAFHNIRLLPSLIALNCHTNPLTTLNISHSASIILLVCHDCSNLSSIDASWCPTLDTINAKNCDLGTLDLRQSPNLTVLGISGNPSPVILT